jgi:hypothetical protein
MLYYTQKKWIWYSIMLIITLIISIGSFIGMLNLIDGPFEDINDNIKLLLLWAIVVLCII